MKSSARSFVLFLILQLVSGASFSADSSPDLPIRYTSYNVEYVIETDGRFVENRSWAKTILREQALAQNKQHSVTYSTSIQRADVLEAYTLKAGGLRIDAPKSNYQVQENRGKNHDAPVFSDRTTLTVVFPDVGVGDTVVFSYRLTATEPMFPWQFSTSELLSEYTAFDDARIRFNYPASLWVQYEARQMTQVGNRDEGGRKVVEWSYRNPKPARDERKGVTIYDVQERPGVALSTFRDYGQIASAYGERARPKAAVTARIQKLADEIAKGTTTPRATAQSLYDWVATQITYAGNCIGLGAVVPHDTDFIIDNRMGDCKDHATLLEALLAAKGIGSTQVLVNAGSTYDLPKIPVVSMVNHVLTYIPSLDIYADSTSNSTPFGMLPVSDESKPVLWVNGFREGTRAPANPVEANRQRVKTLLKIRPDGSAAGRVDVELSGSFAVNSRAHFRNSSKDFERDLVKNVFQSMGFVGSGEFIRDDPTALLDTYRYSATFEVKDLVVIPGPAAFSMQPLLFSEAPISDYVAAAVHEIEGVDRGLCSGGRSIEEYVYEFPAEMKILGIPDNFSLERGVMSYRAEYSLQGNKLTVMRSIDDRTKGKVCSVQEIAASREFASRIRPNFRGQVVYK